MVIIYVISIKDAISSSELLNGESAKWFFTNVISNIVVNTVVIDFSYVTRINHAFAMQYLTSKRDMKGKKIIKEINQGKNIYRLIHIAEKEIEISQRSKGKREDTITTNAIVLDNSQVK
ncbi:MAG: hypothetical protein AB7U98_11015 [Candidatus Nitrosocosmicus sp.]